jgi:hypothetical protein
VDFIYAESSSQSAIQISKSNSPEEIDQIIQDVSCELSMWQNVGSVASDCFSVGTSPTRSISSEVSGHYSSNNRSVLSTLAVMTSLVEKAPSTRKTSVDPIYLILVMMLN